MSATATVQGGRKFQGTLLGTLTKLSIDKMCSKLCLFMWLPPRDSNPDMLIQSQLSYH
jgi:hypothetical protein